MRTKRETAERSGCFRTRNKTIAFLYILLRDTIPAGEVARILDEVEKSGDQDMRFTNGWLAGYAEDCARRLGVTL